MINIKVIILVGSLDFGRCPLGSRLNRAVWPVFDKPALQQTIDMLSGQGLTQFRVCCQGEQAEAIKQVIRIPSGTEAVFLADNLPRGPAGCIKDAADLICDELLLVIPANIVNVPDVQQLCSMHGQSKAPFSVFLNPAEANELYPQDSGIYMCTAQTARIIPECGFMDIKEGLIRELVRAGTPAKAFYLSEDAGHYRTWPEYLRAIRKHLIRQSALQTEIDGYKLDTGKLHWLGSNVSISPRATVKGPVVIGTGSVIEDDVRIFGPTIIGENVYVGQSAIIEECVIWDEAVIGADSLIQSSLVDSGRVIGVKSKLRYCLAQAPLGIISRVFANLEVKKIRKHHNGFFKRPDFANVLYSPKKSALTATAVFMILSAALIYSYWPTLLGLWNIWLRSDEYSSGLLVPVAAAYILWSRRDSLKQSGLSSPSVWGIATLVFAQALRLFGLYYRYASIERLSLVLSLGSLFLIVPGRRIFKRCLPIFIFLFLMLPLPKQVEMQITSPLQRWATSSAVFLLETAGFNVWQEGNIIHINDTLVAVAEACNGLRMLTAFLIVSGMTVLLIRRTWWEKGLILLSSVPIALICNTARLAFTAVFFTFLDTRKWEEAFHDFGGFAMMPVALMIIAFELWLLSAIVIQPQGGNNKILVNH